MVQGGAHPEQQPRRGGVGHRRAPLLVVHDAAAAHAAPEVARGAEGLDARAHGEGRLAVDLDELLHAALRGERRVRLGRAHGRREDDEVVRGLGGGGEAPAAGRDGAVGRDRPGDVELARLAPAALVRVEQDACAVVGHREARRLKVALDKIPVTSAPPASAPAISLNLNLSCS